MAISETITVQENCTYTDKKRGCPTHDGMALWRIRITKSSGLSQQNAQVRNKRRIDCL